MPSYAQAKKVIWDAITIDGQRIIDFIPPELVAQKNQQEMKIRFNNGSLFQLIGSDNIDSLMGTNPKIVVFSEYAIQSPEAWDFLRPILKVNKGYAIFISTPRGRNHFYDLFRNAQSAEGWFAQKLSIEDTGVLTADDVKQEMSEGMSEELALQEYYCSFDRGVEGSYYAKLMLKMQETERIIPLRYDTSKLVHTAFDLGWDDDTAVIYWQFQGNSINIIDVDNGNHMMLSKWVDILKSKPYRYGVHLFPHDVEQTDGFSTGCTRREILQDLGIQVTTVPKHLVADGIESVKALMDSRLVINETKCKPLIKSLEQYHKEWDDKRKVYGSKPLHDWSSHYADAIRMLAMGKHLCDSSTSGDDDYKAAARYFG